MTYCTKCGATLPEDAAFCPVCGTSTKPDVARQQETAAPPTQRSAMERNLILAGWGARFLAWLIDVAILGVVLLPVNAFGLNWVPYSPFPFVNFGASDIIYLSYWAFLEGYMGQSVGKIALGIKVTNMQGKQPTLIEAFTESFGKAFLLPIDLILGWLLYPESRQRLFSYLARTIVVRK